MYTASCSLGRQHFVQGQFVCSEEVFWGARKLKPRQPQLQLQKPVELNLEETLAPFVRPLLRLLGSTAIKHFKWFNSELGLRTLFSERNLIGCLNGHWVTLQTDSCRLLRFWHLGLMEQAIRTPWFTWKKPSAKLQPKGLFFFLPLLTEWHLIEAFLWHRGEWLGPLYILASLNSWMIKYPLQS